MRGWIVKLLVLVVIAGITVVGILEPPNPFYVPPAQAAAPTGGSDNGCTVIGEVGGVTIAHCVDEENGRELYASSVGFVVVVE